MVLRTKMPVSTHFRIIDDTRLVGTLRINPKKILWNSAGRDAWLEIDMRALIDFMESNGTEATPEDDE